MGLFLPKLDKTMPMVTFDLNKVRRGIAEAVSTPQFQIFWQSSAIKIDSKTPGTTFGPETAAADYDQAQMQRVINFCAALSNGLK